MEIAIFEMSSWHPKLNVFLWFFSIKEKDVILQNLQTTESQLKSQLSELETGLETQRAKNNVSIYIKYEIISILVWKGEISR